ncbi:hypothetical protein GAG94_08515 [Lysinibacillus sphaericus]|nr:hypothetical protein GAG94_08515 [Lysinibacillus sphaericus]
MRIVLNTSSELDKILIAVAKKAGKSISQMIIDDAERKYLQTISTDTQCLNNLIEDAKKFSKNHPVGTCFTVSNLDSIGDTALQNEIDGKRSPQRASVTRRLIKAINDGAVPNVCRLLNSNGLAVKIERNSAFIIVETGVYHSLNEKVIYKN